MKRFGLFLGLLVFIASPSQAKEASDWLQPVVGQSYGVQVKEWSVGSDELRMIKDAGLSYVRFVIPWYAVEKGKSGRFVWSKFDRFVRNVHRHGLKAVIVIGGGHKRYTGTMNAPEGNMDHTETYLLAPSTAEQRVAFARYAAAAIKHFGSKDIVWEIWNEPDQDHFWAPKANVEDYAALANEACWAMRKEKPKAHIIGPGMAETPGQWGSLLPGFLGKVLQSPVADCLDAISVHPYRDFIKPPETVNEAYKNLRQFVKAHTQEGKSELPVLATEWGFTMHDVTEEEQAAFLLRSYMLNTLNKVPLSIWYEWRDSRAPEEGAEAHFGLLTLKHKPKLAYKTLKAFLPPLRGARIEKRLDVGNTEDYVLQLKHPKGNSHLVYWSADTQTDTRLIYRCGAKGVDHEVVLTMTPQRVDCNKETPVISASHFKPSQKAKP